MPLQIVRNRQAFAAGPLQVGNAQKAARTGRHNQAVLVTDKDLARAYQPTCACRVFSGDWYRLARNERGCRAHGRCRRCAVAWVGITLHAFGVRSQACSCQMLVFFQRNSLGAPDFQGFLAQTSARTGEGIKCADFARDLRGWLLPIYSRFCLVDFVGVANAFVTLRQRLQCRRVFQGLHH